MEAEALASAGNRNSSVTVPSTAAFTISSIGSFDSAQGREAPASI